MKIMHSFINVIKFSAYFSHIHSYKQRDIEKSINDTILYFYNNYFLISNC